MYLFNSSADRGVPLMVDLALPKGESELLSDMIAGCRYSEEGYGKSKRNDDVRLDDVFVDPLAIYTSA